MIIKEATYDIETDSFVKWPTLDLITTPLSFAIRINNECNLKCIYCLSDSQKVTSEKKTKSDILEIIKILSPARIVFCGGEPILDPYLNEYITFSKDKGSVNVVTTNGVIFPDNKTLDLVDWWDISLHGHDQIAHKNITGSDNFKKIRSNVKKLIAHNKRVGLNLVLTKQNIGPIPNLIENIVVNGIKKMRFSTMLSLGRAKEMVKNIPSKKEIETFNRKISSKQFQFHIFLPKPNGNELMNKGYFVFKRDGTIESPSALEGISLRDALRSTLYKDCLKQNIKIFGYDKKLN